MTICIEKANLRPKHCQIALKEAYYYQIKNEESQDPDDDGYEFSGTLKRIPTDGLDLYKLKNQTKIFLDECEFVLEYMKDEPFDELSTWMKSKDLYEKYYPYVKLDRSFNEQIDDILSAAM